MNHKAIVISQLRQQAARLESELAGVKAAITALGGTVPGPGKPVVRRSRGKSTSGASKPRRPRKQAANAEVMSPALAAELVVIKNNASLSPIQKAQESRKVRLKYRGMATGGQGTGTRPEGAVLGVLGEAASA